MDTVKEKKICSICGEEYEVAIIDIDDEDFHTSSICHKCEKSMLPLISSDDDDSYLPSSVFEELDMSYDEEESDD